ncbi:hypothetical protein VTL71DRAFT_13105 [Oculimacula yallundae]|uniref:NAD-dependent epimerase/dehydratase domain-containing protein n=1 Tax=Oculimacula yallundae TaxID=86028 RepID=A0ABR4CPH4_9HELO
MSAQLVLITGINGFIGYRTLRTTLEAGYVVRGVVRSQSKVQAIKDALGDSALVAKVDFAVVSDMAAPNAFDHLMDGVSFVIHVASPMDKPSNDYEKDMFRPAIDMTINVLSASAKSPNVKRIVITSSVTPLISGPEFVTGSFSKEVFRPAEDTIYHYDIKGKFEIPLLAYAASKALSLEAAEAFIDEKKPHFETVFLMPTLVVGANGLAKTAEETLLSTSGLLLKLLLGQPGNPIIGVSVHVDDVAKLHVLALKPEVPAGRYLVSSEGPKGSDWHSGFAVVKKYFPDAVGKVFVTEAERYIVPANVDVTKTEEAFDFKFASFEEQAKSAIGNYVDLLAKEG